MSELEILLTNFANSVVSGVNRKINYSRGALFDSGYTLMGYIGNPLVYDKNKKLVAQITFHYKKNNDFKKRNPFIIEIVQEVK
jgi:hypothetical protein